MNRVWGPHPVPALFQGNHRVGNAGNANLLIGSLFYATREIGVPRGPGCP